MKVLILGASQGTGALCVKLALAKGHSVTAFSRTPAKLDVTHSALTKFARDFHDAASVRSAVASDDAVIITESPSGRASSSACSASAAKARPAQTVGSLGAPGGAVRRSLARRRAFGAARRMSTRAPRAYAS
ncbi:MAG: NAD(P)H-binding protein [Polyangiaceae bacterium]